MLQELLKVPEYFLNALPGAVAQGMIWGVMAIGLYITYKVLDVADLTVDGSFCTGGAVFAILLTNGYNVYFAILAAFLAGMAAGLITGLLHAWLGIPPILSGILTQLMLWSINLVIMGNSPNIAIPRGSDVILVSRNPDSAILVLLAVLAIVIVFLYWFFGTSLGAGIRATGNNLNMARAQGINTSFNKVLGLVLSNGFVALSGCLLTQYQSFSDASMGRGAIVVGLAAIVIGEAVFSGLSKLLILIGKLIDLLVRKIGKNSFSGCQKFTTAVSNNFAARLIGVIMGSVIYYLVLQFATIVMNAFEIDTNYLKMLSALVVAVFLGIPYVKRTFFKRSTVKKGEKSHA